MNLSFAGILIRQARTGRGWSQEGLCRGICAVSYLSKIEQGKVSAGEDILRLLFERLDVCWHGDAAEVQQSAKLSEQLYETLFLFNDVRAFENMQAAFNAHREQLLNGPYGLDGLLMAQAIGLWPCAYTYMEAGSAAYASGENYSAALEYLQKAYDLAADGGYVHLMMRCRTLMGNCYSNLPVVAALRGYACEPRHLRIYRYQQRRHAHGGGPAVFAGAYAPVSHCWPAGSAYGRIVKWSGIFMKTEFHQQFKVGEWILEKRLIRFLSSLIGGGRATARRFLIR